MRPGDLGRTEVRPATTTLASRPAPARRCQAQRAPQHPIPQRKNVRRPMSRTAALSAPSAGAPLNATTIERRELRERDVLIDIKFCGICHSDIHQVTGRVGQLDRSRWFRATRSPVSWRLSARRSAASPSATAWASGAWSTRAASASTAWPARSSSARGPRSRPTTATTTTASRRTGATAGRSSSPTASSCAIPDSLELAGRGPAAVRRHHHILAAEALERRCGHQGRDRRHGRPRPRRREDRRGDGRRGHGPQPDAWQAGGRSAVRRRGTTTRPPSESTFTELARAAST